MISDIMTPSASHGFARDKDIQLVIVCLTHGAGDNVVGLLNHLRAETIALTTQVIVVHNQSQPNETLTLPQFNDLRVVELPTNRGYVGGMNAGIDVAMQSKPEFVLLLTHDVRITADDVRKLYTLMCHHADLGALGPVLSDSDDVPYSAGFVRYNRVRMRHRIPTDDMPRPIWPCAAIDGSVMMWRASVLEEMSGFDERFFIYFEDVDICARATRRGSRIAVATDVQALSVPGKKDRRSVHAYLGARNGLAYARTFGRAGLVAGLGGCAAGLWHATPKPGGKRFHDHETRQLAARYWHATLLGVFDYFRGRWGPPPPSMLRDSDIRGTSSS